MKLQKQQAMSKRLFQKYQEEYLNKLPEGNPVDEEQMQAYIQMRIEEYIDRFRYEDGDHYEEREPRMPEHDYPY